MIDAARHAFLDHGVREDRLFYDSFEFGSDVPVSILTQPPTQVPVSISQGYTCECLSPRKS